MKRYSYDVCFPYDFIGLGLHEPQCNVRQSRSGSNSAFFRLGKPARPEASITGVDLQKITAVFHK